jgi:glycine/D-amino acid oxidase-like deaminating enzyme/nitrite reductase/ring-hydroxylating ferredoxin subunit
MNRDGAAKSLWQNDLDDYSPSNPWNKDQVYDVLVVGGGVTGLVTALLLQESGKKCIIAEAHNIAFGTSGGTTAHLNTLLDFPYYQVAKDFGEDASRALATGAREAIDIVEALISRYGIDCGFEYKTAYLFSQTSDETEELEKIKTGCENANVLVEWSDAIPVPMSFQKAIKVNFQGQLHPTLYLQGLARAFEKNGGVILQRCTVNDLKSDDIVTADTSLGVIKASKAIYATHLPPGINIFSFRCAPYRSYVLAATLTDGKYPDGLAYDSKDPYHYYRTQTVNGQSYLIAGGNDHKTGHNQNTDYVFTELEAHVREHFSVDMIAYKWSSQYYEPVDGLPYIGQMPGNDLVYVATGYSGNGFTLGHLAGITLCRIISGTETPYEDLFDPGRIKVVAGFRDFLKENTDVISHFVSGRFSYEKISQLVQLAPGEAAIADWEGHKVALYKDPRGHVYAVDPVCTHAGCIVDWNAAEQSWDCPCHGSRFAPNGDLLTGPAFKGLPQVKWEDIEGD